MARYSIWVTNGGAPQTGQSPTVIAWWYKDGSGDPTPGVPVPSVVELDAANAPGWYYFETTPDKEILATIDTDPGGTTGIPAAERYVSTEVSPNDFSLTETRLSMLDAGEIADEVWNALETAHTVSGSMAELMKVIAGLSFRYFREFDHTYDVSSGQLVSAKIRVYATQADANADANHLLELTWTTSYKANDEVDVSVSS